MEKKLKSEKIAFEKRCTVHVASDLLGTKIGNNCIIEQYAIIHACLIGNNVKVGENAIVMDGSTVGDYSIILPDTLIPPGKNLIVFTNIRSPAKLIRKLILFITIIQ